MMRRTVLGTVGLVFAQMLCSRAPTSAQPAPVADDWREQYAYSVGVQAYIYAGPLLYLTQLRHKWTTDATSFPYAALNHFYHFRNIADATYKDGGSPNNDTLYSWGFFDLSKEPVVLVHPDMGQRYFTFELAEAIEKTAPMVVFSSFWKQRRPRGVARMRKAVPVHLQRRSRALEPSEKNAA